MTRLDPETRRKLREMGATALLEAFEARDETGPSGSGVRSWGSSVMR